MYLGTVLPLPVGTDSGVKISNLSQLLDTATEIIGGKEEDRIKGKLQKSSGQCLVSAAAAAAAAAAWFLLSCGSARITFNLRQRKKVKTMICYEHL